MIFKWRVNQSWVKPQLSAVRSNTEHIIYRRIYISALHVIGSVWQLLYKRFLKLCCFDVLNVILHFRCSKVERICCTHIGNLFEHTHQFRQTCIVGDSGTFLKLVAGRSKFPFGFLLTEYRYPVIKVIQFMIFQEVILQKTHHGM